MTMPGMVHKTKSKYYVAVCPACKKPSAVFQFRIQATNYLRGHLKSAHNMTEKEALEIQAAMGSELIPVIDAAKQQQRMC